MERRFIVSKRASRGPRETQDDEWEPLEIEHGPPGLPMGFKSLRAARLTPIGIFGLVVVAVAVAALILNHTQPWLVVEAQFEVPPGIPGVEPGQETHREVMERDDFEAQSVYGKRLLDWPVASMILFMIAGTGLLLSDVFPRLSQGVHRIAHSLLLLTIGFFGLLLAITGTRWLGIMIAYGMSQDNNVTILLDVVPYLNLGVGLLALTGALFLARGPLASLAARSGVHKEAWITGVMLAVAAAGLLLMPILPFVQVEAASIYVDQGDMQFIAENDDSMIGEAAKALSHARAMLWIVLYVCLAGFLAALADRLLGGRPETRILMQVHSLSLVPLILAGVFLFQFHSRMGDADGLAIYPNPVMGLTLFALAGGYVFYATRMLVPFILAHRTPVQAA